MKSSSMTHKLTSNSHRARTEKSRINKMANNCSIWWNNVANKVRRRYTIILTNNAFYPTCWWRKRRTAIDILTRRVSADLKPSVQVYYQLYNASETWGTSTHVRCRLTRRQPANEKHPSAKKDGKKNLANWRGNIFVALSTQRKAIWMKCRQLPAITMLILKLPFFLFCT